MNSRDNAVDEGRQFPGAAKTTDVLIIGGGIMGLWAGFFARRAGLSVIIVDEGNLAGGASGGLLGALMPHTPDRWNSKKQFQFDALLSLEAAVRALEDETGLSTGYRRCGRLIPLPKQHLVALALGHERDAAEHWAAGERQFHWRVRQGREAADLLEGEALAHGCVEDSFAARVSPRGLTAALIEALRRTGDGFEAMYHCGVARLDPAKGEAVLADGERISYGEAVIAAGHASGRLIEPLVGTFRKPLVVPVKGQSALLEAELPADAPVVYLDGLYIVPHEGGHVAIGSTSENSFGLPFQTDHQLDALVEAARQLMPALRQAPVLERWAGLRPKAIGRDPMVGRLPGQRRISVLTGGFKVSFGIAHVLAARLVDALTKNQTKLDLPYNFSPDLHLERALEP